MPVRVPKMPSPSMSGVVVKKEDELVACEESGAVVDHYQSHLNEHHEHVNTADIPPPQQYHEYNMHPLAPPTKKSKYNPYHYDTSLRHPDEPSQQYSYAPENAGTSPIFYAPETVRSVPYHLAMPQSTPPARASPPPPPPTPPPPKPQQKPVKPSFSDKPDSKTDNSNPYSTSRGLRHFSMKVCEKVEEKGTTTYNEVADEVRTCHAMCKDLPFNFQFSMSSHCYTSFT